MVCSLVGGWWVWGVRVAKLGWGGKGDNASFSSVSVRLPPRFFLRRLTDTCVLGNLPKVGTDLNKASEAGGG